MSSIIDEVFNFENRIYMDFNGTTPLAPEVHAAIETSMLEDWGNPSTNHKLGRHARKRIEEARQHVANLVSGRPEGVIFTSGGTESNNMVILGLCRRENIGKPMHVITTNVEHDSIYFPLKHLKKSQGLEITEVDVGDYANIVGQVRDAVRENTVLVTVMAANNETGVIMPLKEIGHELKLINRERERKGLRKIIFHSDGAQIIGKVVVDVSQLGLDCFTIVGHKFYGPRIGALWTRVPIPPLLFGGGSPARPGTENTPMIVGLGEAASLVNKNISEYRKSMDTARQHLEFRLQSLPVAAKVNCEKLPRLVNTCNVSFRVPAPHTGADILAKCKILLAGVGAACHASSSSPSQILMNSGVPRDEARTSIRLSLGRDHKFGNTDSVIQDLAQAISSILWDSLENGGK